nr:G protein-coupled receptor [Proales similis]
MSEQRPIASRIFIFGFTSLGSLLSSTDVTFLTGWKLFKSCQLRMSFKNFSRIFKVEHELNQSVVGIYDRVMRYPAIILRVCGLFHNKSDFFLAKLYNVLICLFLIISMLKMFTVIDLFWGKEIQMSADLVIHICFVGWSIECTFQSVYLFFIHETSTRQNRLKAAIQDSFDECANQRRVVNKLKVQVTALFSVAVFIAVFNSAGILACLFGPSILVDAFEPLLSPFHDQDWARESTSWRLFCALTGLIMSFAWVTPIALYASNCSFLTLMLHEFNKEFKSFCVLDHSTDRLPSSGCASGPSNITSSKLDEFERLRLKHFRLCNLAEKLDRTYGPFLAVVVSIKTTLILLQLYVMLGWKQNCITGIKQILHPFWCIACLCLLLILVYYPAQINSKAHKPFKRLFSLQFSFSSAEFSAKILLWLARFNEKIALSFWAIFPLTKESIFSVAGAMLSYLIVIVQFGYGPPKVCSS